jgi:hypothetical protein
VRAELTGKFHLSGKLAALQASGIYLKMGIYPLMQLNPADACAAAALATPLDGNMV